MTKTEIEEQQQQINNRTKKVEKSQQNIENIENGKENIISKTRNTYNNFQKKIQNKIPGASKFNNLRNNVSKKVTSGVKNAFSKIGKGLTALIKFLFTTPLGWIIMVVSIIFIIGMNSLSNVPGASGPDPSLSSNTTMAEHRAWVKRFNDKEDTDKFYKQYHSTVSGTTLAPVFYAFKDDDEYQKLVTKYFDNLDEKNYETYQEYEEDVFYQAVDEYIEGFDLYQIREMFLDKATYSYVYLAREYSEWEKVSLRSLSTPMVPEGGNKQSYINAVVKDYEQEIEQDAKEHSEALPVTETVTVIVNYKQGHDKTVCEDVTKSVCDGSSCKDQIVNECHNEHWTTNESYTANVSITNYKYRDIIKESWVMDKNDPKVDNNVERESLNPTANDKALYDYWTDVVVENGIEKPWEAHYIESGRIVKRVRHWAMRPTNDVYHDIAFEYNPDTKNPEYIGDILVLEKLDEIYNKVIIEIEKEQLYKLYYVAPDNDLIYQERIFTDNNLPIWESKMTSYKKIFTSLGLIDLDGYPDFTNAEAWRNWFDPEEQGHNDYETNLYGQCTWFAEGMFIQTYGYPMEFTANGNNVATTLVEKFSDRFELSDTPVAGAIFSKGIGAEYGHTGMVVSVSEDGSEITIVHGNMNGISDPWEIAITDWRLETVDISYFEYHYGEAYPYIFANPLDGALQE